ncbi:MAG: hypothetical protein K1X83_10080 [Oligoflexia bacterium]|nr:hypothetical protein [Oligoflexia bacterium]
MKVLGLFLANLLVLSFLCFRLGWAERVALSLASLEKRYLSLQEVRIQGFNGDPHELPAYRRLQQISAPRAVFWPDSIEREFERDPRIQQAGLKRCSGANWRCVELVILERKPAVIARMGEDLWIVGGDGTFIAPLAKDQPLLQNYDRAELTNLPVVDGLLPAGASNAQLLSRLMYVKRTLDQIEREAGLRVKHLTLRESGEMVAEFDDLPFRALFGYAAEDNARLGRELNRLKHIVSQFKGKLNAIRSIDLVYDTMAVVKLTAEVPVPLRSQS